MKIICVVCTASVTYMTGEILFFSIRSFHGLLCQQEEAGDSSSGPTCYYFITHFPICAFPIQEEKEG